MASWNFPIMILIPTRPQLKTTERFTWEPVSFKHYYAPRNIINGVDNRASPSNIQSILRCKCKVGLKFHEMNTKHSGSKIRRFGNLKNWLWGNFERFEALERFYNLDASKFENLDIFWGFESSNVWKFKRNLKLENLETWRFEKFKSSNAWQSGNLGTWRFANLKIRKLENLKIWKFESFKIWKFKDLFLEI